MASAPSAAGPLTGLKVVEFTGIGPGPHCVMLLADLGAEVLRIDRAGGNGWPNAVMDRGRATKTLDLRAPEGRSWARDAAACADVLIEGYRPGVMERLGLGPEDLCAANPRLVYGRLTGWGQTGPLAQTAGHDINYIGLTGALDAMGKIGQPAAIPLNLVGDFGGGSMLLTFGVLAALFEREQSGKGQVVDAAIIDGVNSMMGMFTGLSGDKRLSLARDRNLLSGAAPFYRTYICRDGREIALGSLEPHFFAEFLDRMDLGELADAQYDERQWPALTGRFAAAFAREERDFWAAMFDGSDACLTPVLTAEEATAHPHHLARESFVAFDGLLQVGTVPRFSRTPGRIRHAGNADEMIACWRKLNRGDQSVPDGPRVGENH